MKQNVFNHIKNISGWRTNRKLVIFSVDDYGNVRLASKEVYGDLKKSGIPFNSHFDRFDSLETREDLESLYEVLYSVRDKHGHPAIFTPFALPCNIDFDAMASTNYQKYIYELLPKTFEKLADKDQKGYNKTWSLWKEGIDKGLMKPQFHGREHFNLTIFNDLLKTQNENLLKVLRNESYVSIPEHLNYRHGWTAAYSFDDIEETDLFLDNVTDGLNRFKEVYGFDCKVFTPSAQQFPLHLESQLFKLGLKYFDRPRSLKRHLGNGQYQMEKSRLGDGIHITSLIRNVIFEPTTQRNSNWVDFTFKQIETAFFWRKPANISSHRVNYCGYIDENNRKVGLTALKQLLDKIVRRWPEVEFISADQLGDIISKGK